LTLLQAVILGAIQGLTEFLPISSSGHLVLAESLLNIKLPGITFEVMAHLGTLLAVLVYFGKDVIEIVSAFFSELFGRSRRHKGLWGNPDSRLGILIIIGTIPAGIVALLFKSQIERLFTDPLFVCGALVVTGLVLWGADGDRRGRRKSYDLKVGDAISVGIAQAFAIAPGLSRSGLTVATGLRRRIERPLAAKLAFLLSIPAVGGAVLLDILEIRKSGVQLPWQMIGAGAGTAFLTGLLSIGIMMSIVKAGKLRWFSVYCWLVGAAGAVFFVLRH
jgi:undecaprenyl-diphosphatase